MIDEYVENWESTINDSNKEKYFNSLILFQNYILTLKQNISSKVRDFLISVKIDKENKNFYKFIDNQTKIFFKLKDFIKLSSIQTRLNYNFENWLIDSFIPHFETFLIEHSNQDKFLKINNEILSKGFSEEKINEFINPLIYYISPSKKSLIKDKLLYLFIDQLFISIITTCEYNFSYYDLFFQTYFSLILENKKIKYSIKFILEKNINFITYYFRFNKTFDKYDIKTLKKLIEIDIKNFKIDPKLFLIKLDLKIEENYFDYILICWKNFFIFENGDLLKNFFQNSLKNSSEEIIKKLFTKIIKGFKLEYNNIQDKLNNITSLKNEYKFLDDICKHNMINIGQDNIDYKSKILSRIMEIDIEIQQYTDILILPQRRTIK